MSEKKITVPVKYIPTFVGTTENDEKVVLYKNIDSPHELHIRCPDGELWALGPGSFVFMETGLDDRIRLEVSSTPWTGKAVGTRSDLIAEPSLHI